MHIRPKHHTPASRVIVLRSSSLPELNTALTWISWFRFMICPTAVETTHHSVSHLLAVA